LAILGIYQLREMEQGLSNLSFMHYYDKVEDALKEKVLTKLGMGIER
jgi:hypothetical protein